MASVSYSKILLCLNTIFLVIISIGCNQGDGPQKTNRSALAEKSNSRRIEFIDTLTSMFYHIENTRKCGDNLQSFDGLDLKPLWLDKFQSQIEKTFSLANSLNHLINNVNRPGQLKKNDIHIIESNLLPALSYFLFTQPADNKNKHQTLRPTNARSVNSNLKIDLTNNNKGNFFLKEILINLF